jgi:hypothetical protein
MYFSRNEIKAELTNKWEEIIDNTYPEDVLTEMADGFVPVYYENIIKDWTEMPSEFNDRWKEHYGTNVPEEVGITALMTSDLYEYYRDTTLEIYQEIQDEKEDN